MKHADFSLPVFVVLSVILKCDIEPIVRKDTHF